MALFMQSDQKQHLQFFINQPTEVLSSVLRNIFTPNIEDESDINNASQALLKLFIDTKKLRLSEKDFVDQVKVLAGMSDAMIQTLWDFYVSETASINDLISSDEFSFRDLEWRLEAKIASRFSHSLPPNPQIAIKLHLDKEKSLSHRLKLTNPSSDDSKKELVLQTDANSLVHIIDQLETARTAINLKKMHLSSSVAS